METKRMLTSNKLLVKVTTNLDTVWTIYTFNEKWEIVSHKWYAKTTDGFLAFWGNGEQTTMKTFY